MSPVFNYGHNTVILCPLHNYLPAVPLCQGGYGHTSVMRQCHHESTKATPVISILLMHYSRRTRVLDVAGLTSQLGPMCMQKRWIRRHTVLLIQWMPTCSLEKFTNKYDG